MLRLAYRNLVRRPLRNTLTLAGLASAVAVLACLSALSKGYRQGLRTELDRMGVQLMLVPLGCPYDAAARVLKGNTLETSLPAAALEQVRRDPDVAVAAPMLMAAVPRPSERRADVWVGLDHSALALKPWWRAKAGSDWFDDENSVLLGSEAADAEMRVPGDKLFSPGADRTFRVAGVLERSGTSDDSLFFIPLSTAQQMFHESGRLTAIAIRLRDPTRLREVSQRLQAIPGAQVVTLTEMMGTFLNLLGAVRTLSRAIALIAVTISVLGVLNTLLAAVVERTPELSIMRALGASRWQVFQLLALEGLLLSGLGSAVGLGLAAASGSALENWARHWVPFAPSGSFLELDRATVLICLGLGLGAGIAASLWPAWQASRAHPANALKDWT